MSLQTISGCQNNQFIVWAIFQSKNTKHYLLLFHNVEYFWGPPYLTNIIFLSFGLSHIKQWIWRCFFPFWGIVMASFHCDKVINQEEFWQINQCWKGSLVAGEVMINSSVVNYFDNQLIDWLMLLFPLLFCRLHRCMLKILKVRKNKHCTNRRSPLPQKTLLLKLQFCYFVTRSLHHVFA